ncbi:MAG: DUF975 family protein [Oscillospiraceae bacterium]|nr:DUF975 family protein [Oscillospiraceae bacterium]
MWDRSIIKANAKVALGGRYWKAFLVMFIFTVLTGWLCKIEVKAIFGWVGVLYTIFVGQPLLIGVARYFVRNHFEETRLETMFSGFQWNYTNGMEAMFVTRLFIVLWTLLLVIPGIVKLVQYSMVPFLLSDNPSLPGERARTISRMMTDGQKGAIFVFWLSFLGWFCLGLLCFGVGVLFVLPYFSAAEAELYLFLRTRALSLGFVRPEELCLKSCAEQK